MSMDSVNLTADEIAQLVFEDFTYDAKVWGEVESGEVELTGGSASSELVKDAKLWYDVSIYMSQKALERWEFCDAEKVKCQRGMAYATSLLRELEHAKEQANYLLSHDDSTKENIIPAAKTVKSYCMKTIVKRRRKTVGACVGFPQKGCGQVTCRMGPSGPQTLCNACGVRYLKKNKKR